MLKTKHKSIVYFPTHPFPTRFAIKTIDNYFFYFSQRSRGSICLSVYLSVRVCVCVCIYKLRPVVCRMNEWKGNNKRNNNNNKLAKIRQAKLNIKQKQMLNLVMDIFVCGRHTHTHIQLSLLIYKSETKRKTNQAKRQSGHAAKSTLLLANSNSKWRPADDRRGAARRRKKLPSSPWLCCCCCCYLTRAPTYALTLTRALSGAPPFAFRAKFRQNNEACDRLA